MYEGQPLICKEIIEDNWLEFLAYIKAVSDKELERQQKRLKALEGLGDSDVVGLGNIHAAKEPTDYDRRYYDINLNSFWSWYITNKVKV